jgi:hypothetical protein
MLAWMAPNYHCSKTHIAAGWALAWDWPDDDQPFHVHKDIVKKDHLLPIDLQRQVDLTGFSYGFIIDLHGWLHESPSSTVIRQTATSISTNDGQ